MYDPTAPSHSSEVSVELDSGNRVSVRLSVQDGAVVAGSFSCSPGYELKPAEVSKLPWDKLSRTAISSAKEDAQ